MRLVKIALASLSTTVGATRSNTDRLLRAAAAMEEAGIAVGCFTEQVVGGYPPEDLIQWHAYVDAQLAELRRFADATADTRGVWVLGLTAGVGGQLFNVAAVVHGGVILAMVPKEKLPTYNIFYEGRTFSRGSAYLDLELEGIPVGDHLFEFAFGRLAVEVCEDVWSPDGPMRRRCYSGAELVVNVSSSPYRVGIQATRREMLATRSADNQCTLAYANAVGAQDGFIYDGGGFVFQNGRLELEAPRFRESFFASVVDLERTLRLRHENTTWRNDCEEFLQAFEPVPTIRSLAPVAVSDGLAYPAPTAGSFFLPAPEPQPDPRARMLDDLFEALALGVKDYWIKTGVFSCIGVALSGGRDSLLTLLVAWRAVALIEAERRSEPFTADPGGESEADNVPRERVAELLRAFYMPTRHSTAGTRTAAHRICEEIGVGLTELSIEEAYDREVEATRAMLGGDEPTPITRQNVQARLRAARMWNWANSSGALFLQTGDMSEKAVGYTTIGGDLEGALSVIANVPKTVVIALLERLQARFGFAGIGDTLATPPGPELADEQEAEDELMPFEILDACLHLYSGEKLSAAEVGRALPSLFPEVDPQRLAGWADKFGRLFARSIYKWVQAPLSLHVGSLDLDRERALQLPVVQRGEWAEE